MVSFVGKIDRSVADFNSPQKILKLAKEGRRGLASSTEPEPRMHELRGPSATGYYYTATDKAWKPGVPGDYRHITQGSIGLAKEVMIFFTVFTNDKDSAVIAEALEMLRNALFEKRSFTRQQSYEIGVPGAGWKLLFDIPGYEITEEKVRPDGQGKMMMAVNEQTGMIISVFVDRQPGMVTAEKCRDFYSANLKKSPVPMSDFVFTKSGSLAVMKYMVKEFQGRRIMQQNVNAYLGRGDFCVDIHLSRVNYQPSYESLFQSVLKTVRVKED